MVTTDNCLIDLGMVQSYPGLTGVWERDAIEKNSLKLEDVCHSFQALRLCLTWSQVSRSITSPGLRSSWVKSVISVTVNRPVLLEHSKRRGWTSRISCSLQYSPCRGAELLGNHLQPASLGGGGSQQRGCCGPVPFVTGVGSFPSQQVPELSRLLALRHCILRALTEKSGQLLGHGPLIPTRPLRTGWGEHRCWSHTGALMWE